jgi:hypothetical protein
MTQRNDGAIRWEAAVGTKVRALAQRMCHLGQPGTRRVAGRLLKATKGQLREVRRSGSKRKASSFRKTPASMGQPTCKADPGCRPLKWVQRKVKDKEWDLRMGFVIPEGCERWE